MADKKRGLFKRYAVNLMYLPALALVLFFIVYPFMRGIWISFTDWNGYSQSKTFIGLYNYRRRCV